MAMPKKLKQLKDNAPENMEATKQEESTKNKNNPEETGLDTTPIEDVVNQDQEPTDGPPQDITNTDDNIENNKDSRDEKDLIEEVEEKIHKTTGSVSGICQEDMNLAIKSMEQKRNFRGIVVGVDTNKEELSISCKNFKQVLKMPYDSFANINAKQFYPEQLYKFGDVRFYIDKIDEDNKDIYVSAERLIDKAIKALPNKEVNAEIIFFLNYGALCKVVGENIFGIVRNTEFMPSTYVRIMDVLKIGDTLPVKISSINEDKRMFMTPTSEKYEIPRIFKDEDFVPGKIIVGTVKSIKPSGTFVNLDAGVDGLCSIPAYLEDDVHRGSKVCYRITKASNDNGLLRIKGKILNVVDE